MRLPYDPIEETQGPYSSEGGYGYGGGGGVDPGLGGVGYGNDAPPPAFQRDANGRLVGTPDSRNEGMPTYGYGRGGDEMSAQVMPNGGPRPTNRPGSPFGPTARGQGGFLGRVLRSRRIGPGYPTGTPGAPGSAPQPMNRPISNDPTQYLNDEMTRAGADAQGGVEQYQAGVGRVQGRIADVAGFRPGNLEGYDPHAEAKFGADAVSAPLNGYDPNENLSGYESGGYDSALEGYNPDFSGAGPNELKGVDTPDFAQYGEGLKDYDPSADVASYGDVQDTRLKQTLNDTLDSVRDSNNRAGRINTGWFDKDRGEAIQRVAGEFAGASADRALGAASLKTGYNVNRAQTLGDLAAKGAGFDLERAGNIDTLATDVSKASNQMGLIKAEDIDKSRLDLAKQKNQIGFERAGMMDQNKARQATSVADALQPFYGQGQTQAYGRAGAMDAARQRAGETALGAEQAATKEAGDYSTRTREYGSEIAAGSLDRDQARKNAETEKNQNAWQTGINAAGTVADVLSHFGRRGAGAAAAAAGAVPGAAGAAAPYVAGAAAATGNYAAGKYIDDRWKPQGFAGRAAKRVVTQAATPVYAAGQAVKKVGRWLGGGSSGAHNGTPMTQQEYQQASDPSMPWQVRRNALAAGSAMGYAGSR